MSVSRIITYIFAFEGSPESIKTEHVEQVDKLKIFYYQVVRRNITNLDAGDIQHLLQLITVVDIFTFRVYSLTELV